MHFFKPVYETDLKRFIRLAPLLAPVGATTQKTTFTAVQGRAPKKNTTPGGRGGSAAAENDGNY